MTGHLPELVPGNITSCAGDAVCHIQCAGDVCHIHVWPEVGAVMIASHGPRGNAQGHYRWRVRPPRWIGRLRGHKWERRVDVLVDEMRDLVYRRFTATPDDEARIVEAVLKSARPSRPNPTRPGI